MSIEYNPQFHAKKETMVRTLSETENNRDEQKRQIKELESKNEDLSNKIVGTRNQLIELDKKRENHIRDVASNKSILTPENSSMKEKLANVKLGIEKSKADYETSTKKLDDVTSSSKMMETMVEQLEGEITEMRVTQESSQEVLDVEREERAALEAEKEELKIFWRNIKDNHVIFVGDKQDEIVKKKDLLSEMIKNNSILTGESLKYKNLTIEHENMRSA